MNLKTFKKLANQIADLEKAKVEFDVQIQNDYPYSKGNEDAVWEPIHWTVSTLKQLSDVQSILKRSITLKDTYNTVEIKNLKTTDCVRSVDEILADVKKNPGNRIKYPTLKYYSEYARNYYHYDFVINMITDTPTEQQEEEKTYRYIGTDKVCTFCIPHDDSRYNYLDKGFFFCKTGQGVGKQRTIITNELTLDTYLVLYMVYMQPTLSKQLPNECYVNANLAKLLRVKFEKALQAQHKNYYDRVKEEAMKEYEKFANANILQKLLDGKISHTIFNNIKLTKNSATYETISIEAQDLVQTLQSVTVLDDRTDIYSIIRDFSNYMIDQVENHDFHIPMPKATGDAEKDEEAQKEWLEATAVERTFEQSVIINGFNVVIKRTSANTRRFVNDYMINKIELEDVVNQSACYDSQENYDRFVKSVSKMSLRWHKAIANGVPVKITSTLSHQDYKRAEAPHAAPRIKFVKKGDDIHLKLGDDNTVKIKFNDCLKKLDTLNRKTNNAWSRTGYYRKDYAWAKEELVTVLKECCTFDNKTVETVDEIVEAKDKDGNPILDENGAPLLKTVKKKNVTVTQECLLTDEQAEFVGEMAEAFQKRAIEKSKLFLETAMKNTGATLIDFHGEPGYLVEGKLRKYVVKKSTNQVFNYEKGNAICIVEPGHQVSVGDDALAARLYALKNDSVLVSKIGTLTHA